MAKDFPKINVNMNNTMSDISNPDVSSNQDQSRQGEDLFEKMKKDVEAQQRDQGTEATGNVMKVSGSSQNRPVISIPGMMPEEDAPKSSLAPDRKSDVVKMLNRLISNKSSEKSFDKDHAA